MSRAIHSRGRPLLIGIGIGSVVVVLFALAFADDSFIGFWDQ